MITIASYSRKSVYSDTSDSTQAQYNLAVDYCKHHFEDYELIRYEDEGFTGANINRPAYNRLVEDIKSGLINIVICYKIDRMSRNVKDFSNFFSFLQEHNVEFVSIKEQIDTSTPIGRAMMYISSVFAQMERETIAERVKDGMIDLSKTGKWAGGRAPLGYKRDRVTIDNKSHTILVPDPEGIRIFKIIVDTFLGDTMSLGTLERRFAEQNITSLYGNRFSSANMHRILKNPTYCTADGKAYDYFKSLGCQMALSRDKFDGTHAIMPYNRCSGGKRKPQVNNPVEKWIISVGLHKPLLTSEEYIKIQSSFKRNKAFKKRKYKVGILKGVLRCSCGWLMGTNHSENKKGHAIDNYHCVQRDRRGPAYCSRSFIRVQELDDAVIDILKKIKLDKSLIDNYTAPDIKLLTRKPSEVRRDITNVENKINNLTAALSNASGSSAMKYIIADIENQDKILSSLRHELIEISATERRAEKNNIAKEEKYKLICEIVDCLDTAEYDEINGLLRDLLKECIWDGESLSIQI